MRKNQLYIIASLLVCVWSVVNGNALNTTTKGTQTPTIGSIDTLTDTIAKGKQTVEQSLSLDTAMSLPLDSLTGRLSLQRKDSLQSDSLPPSKFIRKQMDLDNVVEFSAKDSLVLYGNNNAQMYGDGDIKYGDIDLKAMRIDMNMNKSEVYAVGRPDSVGDLEGNPVYSDKSGEYESKTMRYNFKSKKGFITDVVTQQGEGYLTGGETKKMADDEFYMHNGKYTTCDDHDCPHFYLQLTNAKVKPKKNIVTGPAYLVLAGVPLPLGVPFGYFPFTDKYSSGIIMPTFGEDYNKGFYLREGGYYFAINDNIDLALTGEIYTRGSWGLAAQSTYSKRYKFSGNFNLSYITTILGDKGAADYSKQNNFKIAWTHSQDAKANQNMTLSASVNFTTSGYTRNDLSSYYNSNFTENTKSSTINMTYRVPNSKWSVSTTANVSQRTSDSTLTVSFPNLTLTMSQVAPFKRKRAVGEEKWYEKIKLSYSGALQNQLTANQDVFFKKSIVKDWRNGMRHSVPVSATFNMLKYFNITPSVSLNDRMYSNKIKRQWDPAASAVVQDTTYGFYNIFDFSGSLSLDTKVYGFFKPWRIFGDKVQMIRHVLTPTVSFSASPDFSTPGWGYYGSYAYTNPSTGQVSTQKYSYFSNGIFGTASQGKSGTVSMSLANNLEMKVKSDKDSTGVKKVSLIENLSLSQSYNFAADSMRWSNINSSIMLRLVKNFNLNLSATWDVYTYQVNSAGNPVRVNRTRLEAGKGLGRLSSTGTSFSYTLNNSTFKKKDKKEDKEKKDTKPAALDQYASQDDESDTKDGKNGKTPDYTLNPDGYAKWDFPWSLTFNYSVNYSYGSFNYKKLEYNGKFTQNLSFSGNVKPTKNWAFTFSASYDFDAKKIAYMNCSITRDLHCFAMSASFVPVGPYKSYNFHIAVKSSLLSDLKYDKRSSTSNGITWY